MNIFKILILLFFLLHKIVFSHQFYIGINLQINNSHQKLLFHNDYWNQALLSTYKDSLDTIYRDFIKQSQPYWLVNETPLSLFKRHLRLELPEIYNNHPSSPGFSITAGLFFYRCASLLLAIDVYGENFSINIEKKSLQRIFSNTAPSSIKNNFLLSAAESKLSEEEKMIRNALNPKRTVSAEYMYIDTTSIDIMNTLNINYNFSGGMLLRIGSIVKNRLYIFATVGMETFCFFLKAKSTPKLDWPQMVLFYFSGTLQTNNNPLTVSSRNIEPQKASETFALEFNQRNLNWGVVGGCGIEFFINRKLSLRADARYTYCVNSLFTSTNGLAKLHYLDTHWKVGLGLFYRF